jgi:hypothetical protein
VKRKQAKIKSFEKSAPQSGADFFLPIRQRHLIFERASRGFDSKPFSGNLLVDNLTYETKRFH